MRHNLISRLFGLTVLIASVVLATTSFAQRLPECESSPEFKLPPEYPPTLCQEFNDLLQPEPIVLGVPGWMTDADVNLQLGTVVLINKFVYIQGDFTVLANFEFNNCWVSISPGKKIKVGNNSIVAEPFLNVNNSRLFCCNGLWNGIDMEDGARVNTSNGSRIEDATTAIIADGNNFTNTLSLQNTTFNRNRVGVQIGKTSAGTGTSVAVVNFGGNVFSCTSPLNTTLSEITFAGVLVQRISGLTTLNSVVLTEFREIMFGVYVGNHINTVTLGQTFLNIQGLKFNRIINKGIFMEPAVVTNILSCEFINNGSHCIDILKSDQLQVLGCEFTYTDDVIPNGKNFYYGVRFNPNGSNIIFNDQNIRSNIFTIDFLDLSKIERIHCISMYGASDGSDGEHYIDYNVFFMNFQQVAGIPAETRAITVVGGIHPNTENSVLENYCEFKNFSSNFASSCVINMTNGDYNNLFVSNNTFKGYEFDYMKNGETAIRLAGSTGNEVSVVGNFFTGISNNPELAIPFDIGIFVADFENTNFQYNDLRENDAGFIFHGTNENTHMSCNYITGGKELLKLDFSVIGPQGGPLDANGIPLSVNGNEWINNLEVPTFDANCSPTTLAPLSQFFVNGQQSPSNTFFPDMINPSSDWFIGGGPEPDCVFALSQNSLERSIVDGTLANALDNPADTWESERYLYKRLSGDAALLDSWSGFQIFKSAKDGSAMAQLSSVQQMIAAAYVQSPSLAIQVAQKRVEIDALLEDIKQLDAQITNSETVNLMTQRKQKQSDLAVKQGEAASIDAEYQVDVTNKLQVAQAANNSITTVAMYEANTKSVNGFVITLALNGTLSDGQISTLKSIAAQCPRDGGMAVYQARGILPDCELENIKEGVCYPSNERSGKSVVAQVGSEVRITPNPNQGEFLIQAENLALARVIVYDVLGNIIQERLVTAETTAFRFSHNLNAGTYFCRIVGNDGQNRTLSFIVTR